MRAGIPVGNGATERVVWAAITDDAKEVVGSSGSVRVAEGVDDETEVNIKDDSVRMKDKLGSTEMLVMVVNGTSGVVEVMEAGMVVLAGTEVVLLSEPGKEMTMLVLLLITVDEATEVTSTGTEVDETILVIGGGTTVELTEPPSDTGTEVGSTVVEGITVVDTGTEVGGAITLETSLMTLETPLRMPLKISVEEGSALLEAGAEVIAAESEVMVGVADEVGGGSKTLVMPRMLLKIPPPSLVVDAGNAEVVESAADDADAESDVDELGGGSKTLVKPRMPLRIPPPSLVVDVGNAEAVESAADDAESESDAVTDADEAEAVIDEESEVGDTD